MKKCDAYYRRKSLLQHNEFPLQSEIIERHKENLTKVLNQYMDLGVKPALEGAKEDLWVSPSDQLIPNVRIKPPLTTKHVKALTHAGILEIGKQIQEKYQKDLLKRVEVEMKLLADKLNFISKRETTKAVIQERMRAEKQLQMEMCRMETEYNDKLNVALNDLRDRNKTTEDLKLHAQKVALTIEMDKRITETTRDKAHDLMQEFQSAFDLQAQKHTKDLSAAIKMEEEKIAKALKNASADKLEALRLLRHDLECRNMANVMYLLTAERNRCDAERQVIYEEYQLIIDEMTTKALDLYNRILGLEHLCEVQAMKLKSWEDQIIRLCNEFQRFIVYAFKATPTQAQYLMDIHAFVYHHVKRSIDDRMRATAEAGVSGSGGPALLTAVPDAPKVASSALKLATREFTATKLQSRGGDLYLNVPDGETPPHSRQSLDEKDELPSFVYNKYLYVREDFRNRPSPLDTNFNDAIWRSSMQHDVDTGAIIDLPRKSTSSNIGVDEFNYPLSSTVHFHLKPSDEMEISEYSDRDVTDNDNANTNTSNTGGQTDGQQTYINEILYNDSDSVIEMKDGGGSGHSHSPLPILDSSIPTGIVDNKGTTTKPTNDLDKHRGSILRRYSFRSTKRSSIINQNSTSAGRVATRKLPTGDSTYDQLANISSVVDVVSDNTNKHSSKLLVTRNSLVIHRSKHSSPRTLVGTDETAPAVTTSRINFSSATSDFTSSPGSDSLSFVSQPYPLQQPVIPSKLTLVRDSVELIKEKSRTFSMATLSNTKPAAGAATPGGKLNKKEESSENNKFMPNVSAQNNYDEIVMGWSEANKLKDDSELKRGSRAMQSSILMKQPSSMRPMKTSHVAIISEPINVIHRPPSAHRLSGRHVAPDIDQDIDLTFSHLNWIDKPDVTDPKDYYYPKHLQLAASDTDRQQKLTTTTAAVVGGGGSDVRHENVTPTEFIQSRSEALKSSQSKSLDTDVPKFK